MMAWWRRTVLRWSCPHPAGDLGPLGDPIGGMYGYRHFCQRCARPVVGTRTRWWRRGQA